MNEIYQRLADISPLKRYGYTVVRHSALESFSELKRNFETYIASHLQKMGAQDLTEFSCEQYHDYLERNGIDNHQMIKEFSRTVPSEWTQHAYIQSLLAKAEEVCGVKLRVFLNKLEFRVCRPNLDDNNPWHRDHWFPYFNPLVNVYLPLSSSYIDSSLQIVPFSHTWSEEECVPTFGYAEGKTKKNGILYSVPEIKYCKYPIEGHRPDVIPGDFALFFPQCIHGQGNNKSPFTRFSFEFRLEPYEL